MGEAMRALPNEKWRNFVRNYCVDTEHGSAARAYRNAGFTGNDVTARSQAYRMLHDPRVVAALSEYSRLILRAGAPEAVAAAMNIIRDPTHRDHGRMVAALIDRVDPLLQTRHSVEVSHKVTLSADQELLEQYKFMLSLGVARDRLRDLFGGNTLYKLEAQIKTIEHQETIEHRESASE
jgi:hypothetical protein